VNMPLWDGKTLDYDCAVSALLAAGAPAGRGRAGSYAARV